MESALGRRPRRFRAFQSCQNQNPNPGLDNHNWRSSRLSQEFSSTAIGIISVVRRATLTITLLRY